MKYFVQFCRITVGLIFVFSGFVKGIDPFGSAIKFSDYFFAFGWGFMDPLSYQLGVLLSSAEMVIGLALLTEVRMIVASWALLLFISFFTLLTLGLAVFNPVSDCGCFGDAIKLTNWQTFYKSVIILIFALCIFFNRKKFKPFSTVFREWALVGIFFIITFGLSYYCTLHEPLMDFRPYKVGTYLPGKMSVPANAPKDEYSTRLLYKKNGVVKEFTQDNFPWKDTTWKWVETKSILVKEGYKPAIHDFSITSLLGNDITDSVLRDTSYSFLLISHNIEKAPIDAFNRANTIALWSVQKGMKFYCLTASGTDQIKTFKARTGLAFDFFHTDETTLKTIIRSNPGLLLLKNGTIIGKWAYSDFPDTKKWDLQPLNILLTNYYAQTEKFSILVFAFGLFLFIYLLRKAVKKH
jgi:hypothetical protein